MKLITMFILCISLCKNCSSQSQNDLKKAEVEYTANTRGYYLKISIKDQMVSISNDRNATGSLVGTKISDADWEELIESFKTIDLKGISALKSPTEKRFYDGAAIANLKIITNGKEYSTMSFDNGFPPVEIEKLVTKITLLAKE